MVKYYIHNSVFFYKLIRFLLVMQDIKDRYANLLVIAKQLTVAANGNSDVVKSSAGVVADVFVLSLTLEEILFSYTIYVTQKNRNVAISIV